MALKRSKAARPAPVPAAPVPAAPAAPAAPARPLAPASDSDAALAPPPQPLSPEAILRRGILSLEEEASEAVERLVTEQEATYRAILADRSRAGVELLIQALLDRDRRLARTGRELASGRASTKLLREFVRGLLNLADYQSVRAVGDATKTGQIERVLEALGAEPADLRQLRLHGSTLGALKDPAEGQGER